MDGAVVAAVISTPVSFLGIALTWRNQRERIRDKAQAERADQEDSNSKRIFDFIDDLQSQNKEMRGRLAESEVVADQMRRMYRQAMEENNELQDTVLADRRKIKDLEAELALKGSK